MTIILRDLILASARSDILIPSLQSLDRFKIPRTVSLSLLTYLILRPNLYLQVEIYDGLLYLTITRMVLASGSLVGTACRGATVVCGVVVDVASTTRVFRAVVPLSRIIILVRAPPVRS